MQNQRVNRGIHRVEDPAQPCDKKDQPLVSSDAVGRGVRVHTNCLLRLQSGGRRQYRTLRWFQTAVNKAASLSGAVTMELCPASKVVNVQVLSPLVRSRVAASKA